MPHAKTSNIQDKARRRKGRLTRKEAGKGDARRPYNRERYDKNYDAIRWSFE